MALLGKFVVIGVVFNFFMFLILLSKAFYKSGVEAVINSLKAYWISILINNLVPFFGGVSTVIVLLEDLKREE
jgi:hypothetical protein